MPTDPWDVREHEFPRTAPRRKQLEFLVGYAVLAPSGYNTQPWRFVIDDDAVHLHTDPDRALPALDPNGREFLMSCGAALFHLRTAAHHYGFAPVVRTWPRGEDDERVATFRLGPACEPTLRQEHLFSAIAKRRTVRDDFEDHPVNDAEVDRLRRAAEQEGAALYVADTDQRLKLAELAAEAARVIASDPDARQEWAEWAAADPDDEEGVPRSARKEGGIRSRFASTLVHLPGGFRRVAGETPARIREAPLVVTLATLDDSRVAWLEAGQALDRVLLQAASFGLGASFINHPLKVDWIRSQVADHLCPDRHPQAILRIGTPKKLPEATPRRSAQTVTDVGDSDGAT